MTTPNNSHLVVIMRYLDAWEQYVMSCKDKDKVSERSLQHKLRTQIAVEKE